MEGTKFSKEKSKTMVMKKKHIKTLDGIVYRTYSEMDLLELRDISLAIDKKKEMHALHIDMETILATY